MNICENNNIIIDISRNSSSSNFSSSLLKKVEPQNNNNNNLNIIPIKNETSTKYKKAFDILNNMNNNKYTMKYIEENKLKSKNAENDFNNNINSFNYNRNNSPIYLNNNIKYKNNNNRSSSCINNKFNNNNNNNSKSEKLDKHKNRSMKKNNIKINIKDKEKIKDNSNIHEYKINNLSSSYNNNFTNIKTNKIVFIDLKDNDNNFLQNDINNDNPNENSRYTRNLSNNIGEEINDNNNNINNIMFRSGGNANSNIKNLKNIKPNTNINNNISNNSNNKLNVVNKKNIINNIEDKIVLRSKNKNEINNSQNAYNNKKFSNLIIQKLDKNISGNIPNNYIILEDNNKKDILSPKNIKFESLKNKGLSNKESSYYILSKSPILRLCERMIFSRSSSNLRNILSKENILNEHEIILKKKIEELKKKIILCDKILDTPFTASKTADITLNFITSLQEIEFREFPILLSNEDEKKYYINYLKILYHLFEEEIDIKNKENSLMDQNNMILNLRQNLYSKINSKGFRSIRDYLYNIYITKKEYIKEIPKIAEINYLVSQVNNMFEIHNSLKICKFISFTLYLVKEIVKFGNNIKSTIELKIKAKNLIDIINKKLNRFNSKYKIK